MKKRTPIGTAAHALAALLIGAALSIAHAAEAHAQAMTLEQVAKSLRSGRTRSSTKVKSIHFGPKYFRPSSNLYKVFQKSRGPDHLLDWVGITTVDFAIIKQESLRSTEFAVATRDYENRESKRIEMKIYVPHPRYQMAVQANLIEVFKQMKPPALKIKASAKMEVNGLEASMYQKKVGGCSLHIPMPNDSVVNLEVTDCAYKKLLIDPAEHLDLQRLKSKLEN